MGSIFSFSDVSIIKLLRPKQWIKNGFVFAPIIFTGRFIQYKSLLDILAAFLLFCIAASAAYILNDIIDLEKDRRHPKKRYIRPLAAGEISIKNAVVALIICYGLLVAGFFILPYVMVVIFAYLVMNILYSFFLKHIPIIDIFTIAFGFVLRVYAGSLALSVPLSPWMFITVLSLSLYLASIKRKQELILGTGKQTREVLLAYNIQVLKMYANMSAVCAIIFYSIFVLMVNQNLIFSVPVVIFGIFRYWLIVEVDEKGESPTEVLYGDVPLLLAAFVWGLISVYVMWP